MFELPILTLVIWLPIVGGMWVLVDGKSAIPDGDADQRFGG